MQRISYELLVFLTGEAHMPANSHRFVTAKTHKSADDIYRFFAVAVGESVIIVIIGDFYPLTLLVFDIA